MERPPDTDHSPEEPLRFVKHIDLAVPMPERAYPVTTQQWSRLKARIGGIRSRENLWIGAMSFFGATGISFIIGAATLTQVEKVALPVLIFFFSAAFVGLTVAVACLFGCLESHGRRKSDIDSVIEYMEDIEEIYSALEGER
jgi:hypothetical protein